MLGRKLYNDYSSHFKERFPVKMQKISIDAGFTCPNRDGEKAVGGCAYCNNQTFSPSYTNLKESVAEQVHKGIRFFGRKYKDMRYLAYFQSYTNTYASVDDLKKLYDEALSVEKVDGLVISTRPDCLPDEVIALLSDYAEKYYVSVEVGVESHLDRTLSAINRAHSFAEAVDTLKRLEGSGIENCVHVVLGFPDEDINDWVKQAKLFSTLPIDTLKLHQLQIHKGTRFAKLYADTPEAFNILSLEDYIDICVQYLEHLSPDIIIQRFTSQAPPDMLIAPKWGIKNYEFTAKLVKELQRRNSYQGKLFDNQLMS
ncbi:MAG: TIGR01212 family radical SAM protein [Bacteroidales bacterium]